MNVFEKLLGGIVRGIVTQAVAEIHEAHLALADDLGDLRRRVAGGHHHGVIPKGGVKADEHRARIVLGQDDSGADVLSPWVPYVQWAGDHKIHLVPSEGQQMTLVAPGGVLEHGYLLPGTWSDANPSPSTSGDEHVHTYGKTKRTHTKDGVKHESGDAKVDIHAAAGVTTSKGGSRTLVSDTRIDHNADKVRLNC